MSMFAPLVDEAVARMVDALRRQADHVGVPLGSLAATGSQPMPRTARRRLSDGAGVGRVQGKSGASGGYPGHCHHGS
jgi:hypothetical protein